MDEFIRLISGSFDNAAQHDREMSEGQVEHPLIRHVIGECNSRMTGLQEDFPGVFVIEETYSRYNGKDIAKNYLFLYEPAGVAGNNGILLSSFDPPEGMPRSELRNDNTCLSIDYRAIKPSPRFCPLLLAKTGGTYFGENVSEFAPGVLFRFSMEVRPDLMLIKEMLEKNGELTAGFETPIEYRRQPPAE